MIHPEGEGVYFKNKPVSLVAQPKPGYEFLRWDNVSDSLQVDYNCFNDTIFTAIFQVSNEEILPDIITENTLLTDEQPYVVINDLTVSEGTILMVNDGVEIRMPDDGNIIIEGLEEPIIVDDNGDFQINFNVFIYLAPGLNQKRRRPPAQTLGTGGMEY